MTSTTSTTSTTTLNEGKHIGYKKCEDNHIVVLEIIGEHNEGRKSVEPANVKKAKYRCSSAKVLRIYNMFTGEDINNITGMPPIMGYSYTPLTYTVGEIITTDYDSDIENACSSGIHYFLDEELAKSYRLKPHTMKYTGQYTTYATDGEFIIFDITYVNGTAINGTQNQYYCNTDNNIDIIKLTIRNNKIVKYTFTDEFGHTGPSYGSLFSELYNQDINEMIEDNNKYEKLFNDVNQLYDNIKDYIDYTKFVIHNHKINNSLSNFVYQQPTKYTYPMYPTYPTYYGMHAPRYPSFNPYYGFGYR